MEPEYFPFPFPPYSIQNDFMKNLWRCLENGNLGIFESPTGTGKSLSIICGALKWLEDYEKKNKDDLTLKMSELNNELDEISKKLKDDWFAEQTGQMQVRKKKQNVQEKLEALERRDNRKMKFQETIKAENELIKRKKIFRENSKKDDQQFLEENELLKEKKSDDDDLLPEELYSKSDDEDDEDEALETATYTQFFFCSRTHSQLTQFIGELKNSPYADKVSLVPLASRQNYCINKSVKNLGHVNLVNERCLQLQKKKTTLKVEKDIKKSKIATSCPYNPGNQSLLIANIVTKIQDIEEIAASAETHKTCPFYASRRSLPDSQIILVPYNSILHTHMRRSSGINLKNNVVIFDEAHNLLEAIERIYSAQVTGRNILHCFSQLSQYQKRFENLFSAKNVLYISQLSFCLKKMIKILGGTSRSHVTEKLKEKLEPKIYNIEDFEAAAEIDTINIFELIDFINRSKLIHKLQGYVEKYSDDLKIPVEKKVTGISAFLSSIKGQENQENNQSIHEQPKQEEISNNPLIFIMSFLESLKSCSGDGRIFVIPGQTIGQGIIKFLLMNPAAHFHDIVKDARSVILAGGTMEPISEFRDQLFIGAGAAPERILTFSCDHVVPEENILTSIVTQGPTGVPFHFNFQNRSNPQLLNELGRTLENICNIVPGGIVVFLPSYSYEEALYKHFENSGIISKITTKKSIFREPKLASQVNAILEGFSKDAKNPKRPQTGALLFSVVGGKLSEGLNFSDDLGRCVVVVGMPYPNIKSPELQEKIKYLNENVKPGAGNDYYENTCMKAVNQCIGRSVRHINDYATVILLDKRYSGKSKSLPGWIQRTLKVHTNFKLTIEEVTNFFAAKKKKSTQ